MNTRMRNILGALVLCPLVLSVPCLLTAAEVQDDEKVIMPQPRPHGVVPSPMPAVPESPGAIVIVPSPARPSPGSGGTQAVPPELTRETPSPGTGVTPPSGEDPSGKTPAVEIPVVPVLPEKSSPVTIPAVPVLPGVAPVEIPAVPVVPVVPQKPGEPVTPAPLRPEERTPQPVVITPVPDSRKPEPPARTEPGKPAPEKRTPDKQPSPLDFLVKPTPLAPEKAAPDKAADEPKAKKGKQPAKPAPEEAPQKPPLKAEKAKPGTPLRIPPDAARTGDLSFLEGCWRGTRPEYTSKRIITERFCFDKNGNGKRTIDDPSYAGKCTGATKGSFDAQGRLVVTSEKGYCTGGPTWGPAYMVCEGEGESTPCFWRFPAAGGGSQRYKIPLVRE